MLKKTIGIFGLLTLFLATGSLAQQEKSLSLSLEDCLMKAMKNNLDIAVEILNPELADISVSRAKERFFPSLSLNFGNRSTEQASYSWIEASDSVTSKRNDYSVTISQIIPTGGNLSLSLSNYKNDSNRVTNTINPVYSSTLRFNFTQPLLRNFGFKVNRQEIIIAQNNLDMSENQLKQVLQQTIYSVEEAYWNFVYSIEMLKVRNQSLKLAQDLLEKNRKSVEVGTMAPIEILSAQSAVATREADILAAEAQVRNNEDILKSVINIAAEGKGADLAEIIPTEKPVYEKKEVTLEESLLTAMENRPDLQVTRINLKNREINFDFAKNQLLPDLSLQASYWSPGISGDLKIFDPADRFGPPIETIPGSSTDAIKDAFGLTYPNWSVSLTLDIPLNSFVSRAAFAQAQVNLEQSLLQLKNQERQIYLEIKNSVRAVQTDYKRVQAYKVARELAGKKLTAEEERFRVGLTTPYFVLQYQTELSTAQSNELNAIIAYNLSLARLNRATGVSLKEKNIRFTDIFER
jgi:outer membrane protein TolC